MRCKSLNRSRARYENRAHRLSPPPEPKLNLISNSDHFPSLCCTARPSQKRLPLECKTLRQPDPIILHWLRAGFVPNAAAMLEKYYQQDYASQNRQDRDIDPAQYFTEVARKDNKMLYCYFTRAKHQTALLKKHGAKFGDVLNFGGHPLMI